MRKYIDLAIMWCGITAFALALGGVPNYDFEA